MKRSPFRGEVGFIKEFVSAFSIPRVFQGVICIMCCEIFKMATKVGGSDGTEREKERQRERVIWCFTPSQPLRLSQGVTHFVDTQ